MHAFVEAFEFVGRNGSIPGTPGLPQLTPPALETLKGGANGGEDQPRVFWNVRHPDRFEERAEDAWPIPRTRWTRWDLDARGGALSPAPVAAA